MDEGGFLYRGRHYAADRESRPRSMGHPNENSSREQEKGPSLQPHSQREFEQHLNDLKKENFSLKLRIYFLEERVQQKYTESSEDVHKKNIELKVDVESLKQELKEKQQLLDDTLTESQNLTNQNEAELQEKQQEFHHMQEILEAKIQLLQEEARLAHSEAEKMTSRADSESQRCHALERRLAEVMEAVGDRPQKEKDRALAEHARELRITSLTEEESSLREQVNELEIRLGDLLTLRQQEVKDAENTMDEQQARLAQYECAAEQCVGELQKAQLQVRSLQAKIRESEANNKNLQERLGEMECELRSVQGHAQRQERSVQNLSNTVSTKETEVAELYQVIEEQNTMLCSLKELTHQRQLQVSGAEPSRLQADLLGLQGSLFSAQLELQGCQRAQRQGQRREEDLGRTLDRLRTDLQGAQQHGEDTERHNQVLRSALERLRSELQQKEEQMVEREGERQRELEERDKAIRELRNALDHKENRLQDYSDLLDHQQGSTEAQDSLIHKLRERIKERDRALERAVDEKFHRVEEKEAELQRTRLLLREKDRDLVKQRSVLYNNEETIMSVEMLLRGKTVELEQVCEAWRSAQQAQKESREKQERSLRERDALIGQLQSALHTHTQEAQHLIAALLGKISMRPSEVIEELKARLHLRERLFQELLLEHTLQAQEHHNEVQHLLHSVSTRDHEIKESARRLGQVMSEQTHRLQDLRRQLTSASPSAIAGSPADLQVLQDELRMVLRREKESRSELSSLGTSLSEARLENQRQSEELEALSRTVRVKEDAIQDLQRQLVEPSGLPLVEMLTQELQALREKIDQQDPTGTNLQCVLEQLIAEYRSLRDTLLIERQLYQRLTLTHSSGESSEKSLHVELERVQALRGHLEQALVRTQDSAMETERAAKVQGSCGDLCLESSEYADSIEEEEDSTPTAQTVPKVLREDRGELCPPQGKRATPRVQPNDNQGKKRCIRSLVPGDTQSCYSQGNEPEVGGAGSLGAGLLRSDLVLMRQESNELKEKLSVSEATVQSQAEQLKDYRELLKTSLQQDSKQVQVDLQDHGYETCGRSENEAEREDISSPEFDDLEICTALEGGSRWWSGDSKHSGNDAEPLARLVEDLRVQLSHSQTVIRTLQSRGRFRSTSADLALPRKVNGGFQASASQSGPEDDEGWQSSDGLGPPPRRPLVQTELRELVSRVSFLEDQLKKHKGPAEDGKATWTGKFDTLIQAQARELSHLRQRMREGRGVCHILTQHLGDTTKAFEELLRANDVDYYMGQSFREQLAQSGALAQRVSAKISGHHPEVPEDSTGHELLALRLSKELQHKDKIIESLRAKLNQDATRADTPSSGHAFSDITDQSDRTSFISDEQGSTDKELGLDANETPEHDQEERESARNRSTDPHSGPTPQLSSIPQSNAAFQSPQASIGCPGMQNTPGKLASPQSQTGVSVNPAKTGFSLGSHRPHAFFPISHHALHPSPLSSSPSMTVRMGTMECGALWDVPYGSRPIRACTNGDVSSGSSGYQSGTNHTGSDLMKEHLSLRQRLDESIHTNERLRWQLEERLTPAGRENGPSTNIFIQGMDSVTQLANENWALKEENLGLQARLKDGAEEAEQLREAVLLGRTRLKEAALEAERWAGQSRGQVQEIAQLKQERQSNQENVNRLQHELSVLQQQLSESRRLVHTLQSQLHVYQRDSEDPTHSSHAGPGSKVTLPHQGQAPDLNGCHAVGHKDDFNALQQQLQDGMILIGKMESTLHSFSSHGLPEVTVKGDGCLRGLLTTTKTLRQILEEANALLRMFWGAALPWGEESAQRAKEHSLEEEIRSLRLRISEQDGALRDTTERLRSSNHTRENMELLIVSQLSRTRDVLMKARTNLEVKSPAGVVSAPALLVGLS